MFSSNRFVMKYLLNATGGLSSSTSHSRIPFTSASSDSRTTFQNPLSQWFPNDVLRQSQFNTSMTPNGGGGSSSRTVLAPQVALPVLGQQLGASNKQVTNKQLYPSQQHGGSGDILN